MRHLTISGTPQQNGLAERINRTILERVVRCMLTNDGLPRLFWEEAIKAASYLINRCPSASIDIKTLQETWSGKSSYYSCLRTFG